MTKKLNSKFLCLFLLILGLFSLVLFSGINLNMVSAQEDYFTFNEEIKDKRYLHFMIRNWHTTYSEDLMITSENEDFYFSVINGFITETDGKYDFYIIEKDNNPENPIAGNDPVLTKITESNKDQFSSDVAFDDVNGKVVIKYNLESTNESNNGYSISAGQAAVSVDENKDQLIIDFGNNKNIHLVKGHLFYENENTKVNGSNEENRFTEEQDTYLDEDEEKFYSTLAGLHTDKTAEKTEDDREFDLILESWFGDIDPTDIGLILDASGSMGFTSEDLDPIQVSDDVFPEQRVTENTTSLEDVFLTSEQVDLILNNRKTDNSRLSQTGYNYYLFDRRDLVNEYVPLGYWSGTSKVTKSANFPLDKYQDLIVGYYPFEKGSLGGNLRAWMDNAKKSGSTLKLVDQVPLDYQIFEGDSSYHFIIDDPNDSKIEDNWPNNDFKMSADGFNLIQSARGVALENNLLDKNNQFTLSFSIKYDTTQPKVEEKVDTNKLDLFYIGPTDGNTSDNDYFRIIRDTNNSKNRLKVLQGNREIASINNVFNNAEADKEIIITFVLDENIATTYFHLLDSNKNIVKTEKQETILNTPITNLDDYRIILNGIKNSAYSGMDINIDDIKLYNQAMFDIDLEKVLTENTSSNDVYVAYNEDQVIGAITDKKLTELSQSESAGWYYINPSSTMYSYYFNDDVQTSKTLLGLRNDSSITYDYEVTKPEEDTYQISNSENLSYTSAQESPVRFYIDHQGYLRCLYYANNRENGYGTSYVYENTDIGYVKSEALQRALGGFAAKLSSVSPESRVSAVRFSAEDIYSSDLNKLVLLDWTNDTAKMQKMLSLERGISGSGDSVGGTLIGDSEEGRLDEFNYGLTGGTFTWTGLKSYRDFLSNNINEENGNNKKSLIIFTDGKDQEFDPILKDLQEKALTDPEYQSLSIQELAQLAARKTKAYAITNELKNEGYTVYTVMLSGGTIVPSTEEGGFGDYEQARTFLLELSGTVDTPENEKENFFYDTQMEKLNNVDENLNTIDALTNIFTNEIIEKFEFQLHDYSIKDYIDPRFDLITGNNELIRLNSHGQIVIEKENQDSVNVNLLDGYNENTEDSILNQNENGEWYLSFRVTDQSDITKSAFNAQLYFDQNQNSYYVKWINQDVKGVPIETAKFTLWRSRLKLRAKDDFLGGNAVLTNGINDHQNFVYSEKDTDGPSSGVDKAQGDNLHYYSKGFPRTTVNVGNGNAENNGAQLIYLGENLTEKDILTKLQNLILNEDNNNQEIIVDYLNRYLDSLYNTENKSLEDILRPEGLTIPYSYLKDLSVGLENSITLTGTQSHEEDVLGDLVYSIETTPEIPADGLVNEIKTYSTTLNVEYIPYQIFEGENQREHLTNSLIQENSHKTYQWTPSYKKVVGNLLEDAETYNYKFITDEVSGEIALELNISNLTEQEKASLIKAAQRIDNKDSVVYSGILERTYGEIISDPVAAFEITAKDILDLDNKDSIVIKLSQSQETADYDFIQTQGLPIGDYTIHMDLEKEVESLIGFEFTEVHVVNENTLSSRADLDKIYDHKLGEIEINDYLGITDSANDLVSLGTIKTIPENDYTNQRYGLFLLGIEPGYGNLTVSKEIRGSKADSNDEFTFQIVLDDTTFNETLSGIEFEDGITEIQLKGGESVTIAGLPVGIQYTVKELDSLGYVQDIPDNSTGRITDNTPKVEFINTKDQGNLTITKNIKDGVSDSGKLFAFNVEITNPAINGYYGDVEFNNGQATVYLSGGESLTISGLPSGATYKVEEEKDEEYELVDSTNTFGKIPENNKTVNIEFTNTLKNNVPENSYNVSILKWHKKVSQNTYHTDLNDGLSSGETVQYKIEVKNTLDPIYNVAVTDPIPGELIVDTDSITGNSNNELEITGSYDKENGNIIWTIDTLNTGETATLYFDVRIPDYKKEFFWINHAHLTYTEIQEKSNVNEAISLFANSVAVNKSEHPDIVIIGSNEENTDHSQIDHPSFYVQDQPNLYSNDVVEHMVVSEADEPSKDPETVLNDPQIVKEQSVNNDNKTKTLQSVKAGDVITYYLTVKNTTNALMNNVEIMDTIPEGLIWIENQASNGYSYNAETDTISWKINQLGINNEITVWFNVKVPSVEEDTVYLNQFKMNFTENQTKEPYISNEVESEETIEDQIFGPSLVVEKKQQILRNNTEDYSDLRDGEITTDYIEVREGDIVTYYITVLNNGDMEADDVVITDPVPDGLVFVKDSASNSDNFTQQGNTLVWKIGTLQPGESSQVEVKFQVIVPEIVEEVYWRNIAYASFGGSNIQTPSNQVVIGDPPTDSENQDPDMNPSETPDTPENPNQSESSSTTVKPTVSSTTTSTVKNEVTSTGVSPQTGVNSEITIYVVIGFLALIALICVITVTLRNKSKKDNK